MALKLEKLANGDVQITPSVVKKEELDRLEKEADKQRMSRKARQQFIRQQIFGLVNTEMNEALQVLPQTDEDLDEQAFEQKQEIDRRLARMKTLRPEVVGEI